MGEFSWLYAVRTSKQANIESGNKIKLLIPKEYIDTYGAPALTGVLDGYGCFTTKVKGKKYELDLYGVLGFMNKHMCEYSGNAIEKEWQRDKNPMGLSDTNENRCGIGFGCYGFEILCSDYPLKLVPCDYEGTYEDCEGVSFGDPNQGWCKTLWDEKYDVRFSGQLMDPINCVEKPITGGKIDKDGNISEHAQAILDAYKKRTTQVLELDEYMSFFMEDIEQLQKDFKLNKSGFDEYYSKYKNLGERVEFLWNMRNNIEKYPKFKEKYIEFWDDQPNKAHHSLIK